MIKKMIYMFIMFCMICNSYGFIKCSASEIDYKQNVISILLESIEPKETELVYRGDCLGVIMKAVGVPLQENVTYSFYNNYATRVYLEQGLDRANDGYIIIEYFAGVAKGRNGYSLYTKSVFEPFEYVTYKECLAFILRCLYEPSEITWDNIEASAYNAGLITADEWLNSDVNAKLDYATFKEILSRMLECKRYLYYDVAAEVTSSVRYPLSVEQNSEYSYIDWILNPGNQLNNHWINDRIFKNIDKSEKTWIYGMPMTENIDFRSIQTATKKEIFQSFQNNYEWFEYMKNNLIDMKGNSDSIYVTIPKDNDIGIQMLVDKVDYLDSKYASEYSEFIENIPIFSQSLTEDIQIQTEKAQDYIIFTFTMWTKGFSAGLIYSDTVPYLKTCAELIKIKDDWYYYRTRYFFLS